MIVRMESKPCDLGRSVIRFINTYWKGPSSTGVSKHCRGAFDRCTLVLDSWHCAHPFTYCSTNSWSLGPSYCLQTSSQVFEMPGYPVAGESWRVWRMSCWRSGSSSRKILCTLIGFVGAMRWSGSRMQGSLESTPLLRSFLHDSKSAMVFVDPECAPVCSWSPARIQSTGLVDQWSFRDHGSTVSFYDQYERE